MKAMVLAAGAATGLYPLTYTLPQALVPVLNRPAIEHLLEWLASHEIDDVVINLHYLHASVRQALQPRIEQLHVHTVANEEANLLARLGRPQLLQSFVMSAPDTTQAGLTVQHAAYDGVL